MKYDPQNIEDGIYTDMPIKVYHENKTHLSASSIKESYKSNAHLKAYLEKKQEKKLHFDFGNAFELSLVNYKDFENSVAIFDDNDKPEPLKTYGSKLNKEWKAKFYEDNVNKLIIPLNGADSLDTLIILKNSLYKHPAATALLKNTEYQTSIFWTDPKTGLQLKTRPDFWKPATKNRSARITDLKTDVNTESDAHIKKICNLNYPIQATLQLMGLKHAKLIDEGARFFWVVCSKTIPFNTEVYEFDTSDITLFTESLQFKLEEIKKAVDKGIFLSYEPNIDYGVKTIRFPFYYKQKLGIQENIDI